MSSSFACSVERGEPARGALGQHDPDDLARARVVVVEAGVEQELFHRRGHALRAVVPDVVEQRAAPDRARVRLVAHPRQLPPVRRVGVEGERLVVHRDGEEVPPFESARTSPGAARSSASMVSRIG